MNTDRLVFKLFFHHSKYIITLLFWHAQLRSFITSQETVVRFTPLRRMAGSLVRYVFMAGMRHLFWGLIWLGAGYGVGQHHSSVNT